MSYQKVHNPEKVDVTTGFKGQYYTILAGETKEFPQDLAEWFMETYQFLQIGEDTKATIAEKKVVALEEKEESKATKVVKK